MTKRASLDSLLSKSVDLERPRNNAGISFTDIPLEVEAKKGRGPEGEYYHIRIGGDKDPVELRWTFERHEALYFAAQLKILRDEILAATGATTRKK